MNRKVVAIVGLIVLVLAASSFLVQTPQRSEIEKFSSDAEFREYLAKASATSAYLPFYGMPIVEYAANVPAVKEVPLGVTPTAEMPVPAATPVPTPSAETSITRYSQTNVQVFGIDEPDIVKTDGKRIYYSHYGYYAYKHYYRPNAEIKIINAFPPSNLSLLSEIDVEVSSLGNLLLVNDTLVVLT